MSVCRYCGKEVPFKKGARRKKPATICRGRKTREGKIVRSKCELKYFSDWQKERYWGNKNRKIELMKKRAGDVIINTCLKCGRKFPAQSRHNRTCEPCSISNQYISHRPMMFVRM